MFFKNIKLSSWQQFETINIDLNSQLTILTGANGSGKTTLLNILAKHSGWEMNSFATPKENSETNMLNYFTRWWQGKNKSDEMVIGTITYENKLETNLLISNHKNINYQINIQKQQELGCFFIPSHRTIFKYQKMKEIPIEKKNRMQAFEEVFASNKKRYEVSPFSGDDTSFLMKGTLIGWAVQGYGNKAMVKDQELINNYEGFKKVLKIVLPKTLGFQNFEIRDMEIVFICNDGEDEFLLETASGGISALIDIAWQIYMYETTENKQFTVVIDEIENHLHPVMQRNILPNLLSAFPNTKFIVSTHSPLIVGSVKNSTTYALKYNSNNKIESFKLDFNEQVKNATEILDEVLGVSFTMPIWVEDRLEIIVKKYSSKDMSSNDFNDLREELKIIGLEKLMSQAIVGIVENNQ